MTNDPNLVPCYHTSCRRGLGFRDLFVKSKRADFTHGCPHSAELFQNSRKELFEKRVKEVHLGRRGEGIKGGI